MYINLAASLERVREQTGVIDRDPYITELLQLSAGTDPNIVTHYRVFLVSARILEQDLLRQTFKKADQAEFTLLAKPIESLIGMQIAYDTTLDLEVPPGFEAVLPDCVTCSGSSGSDGSSRARYPARSYQPVYIP